MIDKKIIFPEDARGRVAAQLVNEISSQIKGIARCQKNNRQVNAKSLLGVLSLGIQKGDEIEIETDSNEAMLSFCRIIQNL